jgi:hypothetical protein
LTREFAGPLDGCGTNCKPFGSRFAHFFELADFGAGAGIARVALVATMELCDHRFRSKLHSTESTKGPLMAVGFARPDVSGLVFHVFDRSVHPELFVSYAQRELLLDEFALSIHIGDAGHMLQVRSQGRTVSEVATTTSHPLPTGNRFFERRMRGSLDTSLELKGLRYYVSYQVDQLEPEVFLNYQDELCLDARKAELAYHFPTGNRFCPGPLSYVTADAWSRNLLVHTFHTFPDNQAVVKTQSLFEI